MRRVFTPCGADAETVQAAIEAAGGRSVSVRTLCEGAGAGHVPVVEAIADIADGSVLAAVQAQLAPLEGLGSPELVKSQPLDTYQCPKRLAVFDMDSTLIEQEVIDEIADLVGVKPQIAAITERAMNGELDFSESFRARVELLRGLEGDIFSRVRERITFTPGARELCRALKQRGMHLAVVSGGFLPLARYVQAELGLDEAYANELEIVDGVVTGKHLGTIVNAERKQALLLEMAQRLGIDAAREAMAVGDGANDLLMMGVAALGVAWNAKPRVQLLAPQRYNGSSLLGILYLLGIDEATARRDSI